MIDLECPFCGRVGSVPREKANTRLVCKKCHMIFHMSPTGRASPGEPPVARPPDHGHAHATSRAATAEKESGVSLPGLGEVNPGLLGVLGALLLVCVVYVGYSTFGSRGSAALFPVAQEIADAIKNDDLSSIQLLSAPDGTAEVATWYETVKRVVEDLKQGSSTRTPIVQAVVTDENPGAGKGQVEIFIIPSKAGTSRNEEIARAAGTTARSTDFMTYWVLSGGRWRFDAKQTLQVTPPR